MKKILIGIIVCIVLIVGGILLFNKKEDKLKKVQDAIENIFFYLPEEKYDNLNDISDYCKISLVYGTDFAKVDTYLSTEDYDTESSKKGKDTVEAYNVDNIIKGLKQILGNDADIKIEKDDDGVFNNLIENGCGYNNSKLDTLSYNESKNYLFSTDLKGQDYRKLYIKWNTPIINGNKVTLKAYALLAVENEDGSYEVYADGQMNLKAGEIEKNKNVEKEINDMFEYASREYNFTLNKIGDNYIWEHFEIIDDIYKEWVLID